LYKKKKKIEREEWQEFSSVGYLEKSKAKIINNDVLILSRNRHGEQKRCSAITHIETDFRETAEIQLPSIFSHKEEKKRVLFSKRLFASSNTNMPATLRHA
jgi:hypothetical protein